jgi:hypothetical protein
MIIVIYYSKIVVRQTQIPDFFNPSIQEVKTIKRYKRVNFTKTIDVCFKKRKQAKKLYRRRLKKFKQLTLERTLVRLGFSWISLFPSRIPHNLNENSPENLTESANNQDLMQPLEGPYLYTYPYMHIDRFYSVPSVSQEDFCNTPYLEKEWKYFQEVEAFNGLFQHMIALNSFKYWDTVEEEIRAEGFHPKGFTLVEFIKWEFLRHSMGIENYSKAARIFSCFDPELLKDAFEHPNRIPKPYHASHYYKWLTAKHFHVFFLKLVADCVKYKIIIPRIVVADGLIFRTWAGNFTLDRWANPTDPQATITVHNKKFLGKCYNAIVFYAWCGNRWLPVDLRVITGSANENNVFHPLVEDFLNESPYNWDVFLYDSGACSAENREFLKSEGMISGIVARKNIKREVILDVGHKRFCFSNDIPEGMSLEQYKRLLDHRSQEEAGFSGFTTYNNMKRMNSMGQEMATIHVTKYLILQLLTALSAYKVNRPDLIMMYKAFSSPA